MERTFDLNNPEDAREYILTWVEYSEADIVIGTDADHVMIAKQLFLYCDPRPALGDCH